MNTLDSLRASYDRRKLAAESFAFRLGEQIREMLNKNDISLAVPLEYRVKSWESISAKLEDSKVEISEVSQLNDFIGLRVILLFKRDVISVQELLSSSLDVLSSEDTLDRLGVEQFGYQSVHLQLRLPESWRTVPTFSDFVDLSAEVQVRTAAQHIWAAVSHNLQYKQALAVPAPVRRSINRVAALLETVDLEFERVLQQRQEYDAVIDSLADDSELNVDLLRRILDERLPSENRKDEENYGELLSELAKKGVLLVKDLNSLIDTRLPTVLEEEKEIVRVLRKSGELRADGAIVSRYKGLNRVGKPDRIKRGVFRTHIGLVRRMLKK